MSPARRRPLDFELVNLGKQADSKLLASFAAIYNRTFLDTDTREDPQTWRIRLAGTQPEPEPLLFVVLAIEQDSREVIGGVVFEYYRASACGLISYLLVQERARHHGVGRALASEARVQLHEVAQSNERQLAAIFAEAEVTPSSDASADSMRREDRLAALSRLGAMRLDVPYVQPELHPTASRVHSLALLSFALHGAGRPPELPVTIVESFLREYYLALGVENPSADPDFAHMSRHLRRRDVVGLCHMDGSACRD